MMKFVLRKPVISQVSPNPFQERGRMSPFIFLKSRFSFNRSKCYATLSFFIGITCWSNTFYISCFLLG